MPISLLLSLVTLVALIGCAPAADDSPAPPPRSGATEAPPPDTEAEKTEPQPAALAESEPQPDEPADLPTFTNSIDMQFVLCPAGTFVMGSPPDEIGRTEFETQHEVTLTKPFYMALTEVTQTQYQEVMGTNPSKFPGKRTPVQNVAWADAVAFCEKLSEREGRTYRLPTEAEWEYACRAGTTTPFAFGETIDDSQVNFDAKVVYGEGTRGVYRARPVAADGMAPNAWGIIGMHGNVQEWCADWYDQRYYAKSPKVDPKGPGSGRLRAMRGGNYVAHPQYCRSAHRFGASPGHKFMSMGFRVVLEP
ncbi:MAG: SUMF1/EgtB/PvdO family nonheme iron enzyme [Phycisphaerales bacterium JB038]